jgi:hypothetical protein
MVFSEQPVPRCYKQDNCSNELVVEQLPATKKVRMEGENIVGIHHQAATGEDTADWENYYVL